MPKSKKVPLKALPLDKEKERDLLRCLENALRKMFENLTPEEREKLSPPYLKSNRE